MKKRKFIFSIFKVFLLFLIKIFSFNKAFSKTKNTYILFHEDSLNYKITENHPEKPERIRFLLDEINKTSLKQNLVKINLINFDHDPYFWIKKIHSSEHIISLKERVKELQKLQQSFV